jgi:hypothetical protein
MPNKPITCERCGRLARNHSHKHCDRCRCQLTREGAWPPGDPQPAPTRYRPKVTLTAGSYGYSPMYGTARRTT